LEGILQQDNRNSHARRYLLIAQQGIAHLYRQRGLKSEAEPAYRKIVETAERLARDNPNSSEDAVYLGGSYCNLGHRLRDNNKPEAALASYSQATQTLEAVLAKDSINGQARRFLANSLSGAAVVRSKLLGRHAEALQDLDRLSQWIDETNRDWVDAVRGCVLARQGDYSAAVARAQKAADKKAAMGEDLNAAASAYALAAGAVQKQNQLPSAERDKLAEQYAARAVDLLSKAIAKSDVDTATILYSLRTDPDNLALRSRDDFKKLVRTLER
jgi:tetratricopeptide (TPR) repeat protein